MGQYKIGFVGQGFVGGSYADDFENRGYDVVRYDITPKYKKNKRKLKNCDIVFVAVPTPTTPEKGFDDSILISAIKATSKGQCVIIKSTIQIGTTDKIQKLFPDTFIMHSPEFLTEKTCKKDAANPDRNIIGYTEKSKKVAKEVMKVLPKAPYEKCVPCREAEFVKYMGNCWFYAKVVMMNLFWEVAKENKLNVKLMQEMLGADSRVGYTHLTVEHQGGRGAGGHCFIKDFEAFIDMYRPIELTQKQVDKKYEGWLLLNCMREYNIKILKESGKSLDILKEVYGNNK